MENLSVQSSQSPEDQSYRVQLEVFEGPLDLLLHLIRQQEIDIYDIPIARITDQYLAYLDFMKDLNITVAGEFLVMAATLIFIKSRMLLPTDPSAADVEGEEDPRIGLVEQLLEHEKFKNAAQLLYEKETVELSVWPRGFDEFEEEEKEAVSVNVFDLIQAFHAIVQRYKENIIVEVEQDSVTIEEVFAELRGLLKMQQELFFSFFVRRKASRYRLALTFFALLEMVRCGEVRLRQKGIFEDIRIVSC